MSFQRVVPAKAGTHTLCLLVSGSVVDTFCYL